MVRSFRGRVGTGRITSQLDPMQANYTREIRKQMQVIENNVSGVINELRNVSPDVLYDALLPTFKKSQRYVPKDTGELAASGFLKVDRGTHRVKATIGYGLAGNPLYAVFVHERLDVSHAAPTRAKFLQGALEEDANVIAKRIRAAYRKRMGF